jgi:hypothetical protein
MEPVGVDIDWRSITRSNPAAANMRGSTPSAFGWVFAE